MFEKIKAILVDELQIKESDITPEAELVNDLGINSLELADLIMVFEEQFDIEIPENDIRKFLTVNDIVNYFSEIA
jgi:acyl carrier protein